MMKIKFLGAAKTVTGSCFLLTIEGKSILIDCGLFQGLDVEEKNNFPFAFNPQLIDSVVLTHAHLDHSGLIPRLYKEGFRGNIYMTIPTRSIVEHILLDSAKVQEIRFRESNKNLGTVHIALIQKYRPKRLLYDTTDVLGTLRLIIPVPFDEVVNIAENINITFLRVGHALGAASIFISFKGDSKQKSILFSGDIGNKNQLLDSRFDIIGKSNYVVMESLYGGRYHEDRRRSEEKLLLQINSTIKRGGNVIIPAFSLQRTQEIIYMLKLYLLSGKIPLSSKVFVDSPLAVKITSIYRDFYSYLGEEILKKVKSGDDLFNHQNIILIQDEVSSLNLRKKTGSIILAGNGMCAGGRIIRHLYRFLPDSKSTILFVGFQAPGTLGREILDGAEFVHIYRKKVQVKAEIVSIDGLSAHSDQDGLLDWIKQIDNKDVNMLFLVHSDSESSVAFRKSLEMLGYNIAIPDEKSEYNLE